MYVKHKYCLFTGRTEQQFFNPHGWESGVLGLDLDFVVDMYHAGLSHDCMGSAAMFRLFILDYIKVVKE